MGNPDNSTPKHIVDKLIEAVQDPKSHRYSSSKGISGLRKAQAEYYERRFNVKLNYETEVVATLGSKEGLANMAQVLSIPSDTFLVPNPAYPIHAFGFIISGANLIHYRINEEIDLKEDFRTWYLSRRENMQRNRAPSDFGDRKMRFSFCLYPFILDAAAKANILRYEASVEQQKNQRHRCQMAHRRFLLRCIICQRP